MTPKPMEASRLSVCYPGRPSRLRSPLILLVGCAIACGIIALLVGIIRMSYKARPHGETKEAFGHIGKALRWYSDDRGTLPPPSAREPTELGEVTGGPNAARQALFSWRLPLTQYLEDTNISWDPSQPWNSPANRKMAAYFCWFFSYRAASPGERDNRDSLQTNALAITGPGTAWGNGEEAPMSLDNVPPDTILVVEVRSSGIHWMQPGDFDIRTMPQTINAPDGKGISSRYSGGFHVIFADGQVWFISDKVPFETLKKFFTVTEAKKHDREKVLGPYALDRPGQ